MTFELFDGHFLTQIRNAVPRRSRRCGLMRWGLQGGGTLLAIGATVVNFAAPMLPILALDADALAPSTAPQRAMLDAPFVDGDAAQSVGDRIGAMLPDTTIAMVIVDVAGDWQTFNQFDTLPVAIDGLIGFPHIPQLPAESLVTTLSEWAAKNMALAWLPSSEAENGSYGITIVPLADTTSSTAARAQLYRKTVQENWESLGLPTETQTHRGVEIWTLLDLQVLDFRSINPTGDPTGDPTETDASPMLSVPEPLDGSIGIDAPIAPAPAKQLDGSSQPSDTIKPGDPVPSVPTAEAAEPLPPIAEPTPRYAIAQLDDRLLFAAHPDQIQHYLDTLNWGEPSLTLPDAVLPDRSESPLPTDAIAEDAIADTASINPESNNPESEALETVSDAADRAAETAIVAKSVALLGDVPAFQEIFTREPEGAAAIVYADVPRAIAALGQLPLFSTPLPDGSTVNPAELLQSVEVQLSSLDGFLWFEASGARLRLRTHYSEPQPRIANLVRTDDETLQHVPASSALTLTTRGFDVLLPEILAVYDAIPSFQAPLNLARREILNATGLSLDQEIVPLLDGDVSLFVFPTDRGLFPQALFPPLGIGVTIETSDRAQLEQLISQLEAQATEAIQAQTVAGQDMTGLAAIEVEGFDVVSWQMPSPLYDQLSLLSYTWITDDTLLVTSGADLMPELLPVPYQSLLDSSTYQSSIAPFPQPNISLFHVNMGSILSLANRFIPPSVWRAPAGFDVARMVRSVRSFSESTTATEAYAQDDIHIQLTPRQADE